MTETVIFQNLTYNLRCFPPPLLVVILFKIILGDLAAPHSLYQYSVNTLDQFLLTYCAG